MLIFIVIFSFFGVSEVTAAQWNVGEGQDYATIQSAIDSNTTLDGDVINVFSGVYCEDVLINKKLTIKVNNGSKVELKSTKTGFKLLNGSGGSTITGFKITSSGIGINISADNCKIKGNKITGGNTGIFVSNSNSTILDNIISGQSANGVLGNLTGGFFTFNGNHISNIIGTGQVTGISIAVNGSLTDFNAVGNIISNINGVNAFGIELGKSKNASGYPEVANVENLIVSKNTINGIIASSAIIGMELVSTSTKALISENYLSKLNGLVNSTVYGLEAVVIGNGTVMVSKNRVFHITAGEQEAGIVTVSMGNLKLEDNKVSDISKAKTSIGILGLGFGNLGVENNQVSHISSSGVAAGIVGVALENLDMLYNTINNLNGANDASMIGAGFNKTVMKGNNIEGSGAGIGIVICSFNGTINYNRIVNLEHYIQNFKFSSFGPNIDEMLKPIDDAIKKHPELEPTLKPIRDDLDKLFHKLENSNTTATYNWYGTNNPDSRKFFKGNGTLIYDPWLVLNIHASPSTIHTGKTSTITADVYRDSAGGDHSVDAAQFFSGPQITFATNLGNVGSKSITTQWVNGFATATLMADEGTGIATVTASDHQSVQTLVNILGAVPPKSSTNTINATSVNMQDTGIPILMFLMAILMLFSGFLPRKK